MCWLEWGSDGDSAVNVFFSPVVTEADRLQPLSAFYQTNILRNFQTNAKYFWLDWLLVGQTILATGILSAFHTTWLVFIDFAWNPLLHVNDIAL